MPSTSPPRTSGSPCCTAARSSPPHPAPPTPPPCATCCAPTTSPPCTSPPGSSASSPTPHPTPSPPSPKSSPAATSSPPPPSPASWTPAPTPPSAPCTAPPKPPCSPPTPPPPPPPHAPPGVAGELYLAGRGIARGYARRPTLTAERFVADPFTGTGQRMYRTGDLARWNDDGHLDYLGRTGDQVKILGFRVEPGDIEAAIATYPGIAHTAVTAHPTPTGDKRLTAYIVPADGVPCDTTALRAHTRTQLPDYMIPTTF